MKQLTCKDAGILDCNWQFRAPTEDEILKAARDHSRKVHNHVLTPDEENRTKQLIKTV